MTLHEQSILRALLDRAAEFEPRRKDRTAEALVLAAAAAHPRLAYRLAYRAVVLTLALETSQAENEFLRRELRELRERAKKPPAGGAAR